MRQLGPKFIPNRPQNENRDLAESEFLLSPWFQAIAPTRAGIIHPGAGPRQLRRNAIRGTNPKPIPIPMPITP
jgi:hypothetical protein